MEKRIHLGVFKQVEIENMYKFRLIAKNMSASSNEQTKKVNIIFTFRTIF